MKNKKFFRLDDLDKKEIIYNAIGRYIIRGATAYEIARKSGCSPDTARKYLNWLTKIKLVKMWKIGRYKVYAPNKTEKNQNIRLYIEKKSKK